jgi:hypothetical protein
MDSRNFIRELSKANVNLQELKNKYFASVYSHSLILYSTLMNYYGQDSVDDIDEQAKKDIKDSLNKAIEYIFHFYSTFLLNFNSDITISDD